MTRGASPHVAAVTDHPHRQSGVAVGLFRSLRPEQWSKNLLVFAGLLFARRLFDLPSVLTALAAFTIFCALSGTVYLVNDIADRDSDRTHPLKSRRPIASGRVSVTLAAATAVALALAAL